MRRLLTLCQCTLVFTPRESLSGAKMVLGCFQRVVIYSHDSIFHSLWVTLIPTDSLAEVLLEAGNNLLRHSPFPTDLDQLPILILGFRLLEGLYPVLKKRIASCVRYVLQSFHLHKTIPSFCYLCRSIPRIIERDIYIL